MPKNKIVTPFKYTICHSKSRCSSVVEHFLGKEEVWGSIPHNGSVFLRQLKNLLKTLLLTGSLVKIQSKVQRWTTVGFGAIMF